MGPFLCDGRKLLTAYWDLGDPGTSKPSSSALPRTLSRAHKMTVATVIAGQVIHIRTTVESINRRTVEP